MSGERRVFLGSSGIWYFRQSDVLFDLSLVGQGQSSMLVTSLRCDEMEGGAGDEDWACPPQWVRAYRGSGTKMVKPVEESSDEYEVCKGVKAQEELDDKFQL